MYNVYYKSIMYITSIECACNALFSSLRLVIPSGEEGRERGRRGSEGRGKYNILWAEYLGGGAGRRGASIYITNIHIYIIFT